MKKSIQFPPVLSSEMKIIEFFMRQRKLRYLTTLIYLVAFKVRCLTEFLILCFFFWYQQIVYLIILSQ